MVDNFKKTKVAYFSMEIALENDLKTYAGGLGVLAGDLLRAASELNFPMVGITLLNPRGYLKQKINIFGNQVPQAENKFDYRKFKKLKPIIEISIGQDIVKVNIWQYCLKSDRGIIIPVYFLDTNHKDNSRRNRKISNYLYNDNRTYRLKQEIILGRGGVKLLNIIGYQNIQKIHLNEGHGSLAGLELLTETKGNNFNAKLKAVRDKCVFTTHTSIPDSQEVFSYSDFIKRQPDFPAELKFLIHGDKINFTLLGFYFSSYANAVSRKHQEIVSKLYPLNNINSNTNGVSSIYWTSEEFKKLYDKYIFNWRVDNSLLKNAFKVPLSEINSAHQKNKNALINYVNKVSGAKLKPDVFTIVYARRFVAYKRPLFLFNDISQLLKINQAVGKIQLIYSGKAHRTDKEGKKIIKNLFNLRKLLKGKIELVFVENYDLDKAKLLVSGADLWLNTPLPFNEASGTSGMKAAHNGVPQLSTLDGWWPEGYRENKTGWAISEKEIRGKNGVRNENNLYSLLADQIIPLYYNKKNKWLEIMRNTISLNAAYFNSQRNLKQYIKEAYKIKK
ncbi:MAG: alpha-glucan family phosphorylase [Patescibacteria group bacterium]